ncbi:hypothetical protein V7S43_016123 [Phytophthora oleae]|uniref:Uncharacterized protein n=1 Tax=Phytophthora oleae TaxID=2107226 RepID=A0ABD3EWU6_9STRA
MEDVENKRQHKVLGDSQEPWDPTLWCGDVGELKQRLQGMSIPHNLQRKIYNIMTNAPVDRYPELLAFLMNTTSQLSRKVSDSLLELPLEQEDDPEVTKMLQNFNLLLVVLQQWKETAAK